MSASPISSGRKKRVIIRGDREGTFLATQIEQALVMHAKEAIELVDRAVEDRANGFVFAFQATLRPTHEGLSEIVFLTQYTE